MEFMGILLEFMGILLCISMDAAIMCLLLVDVYKVLEIFVMLILEH